MKMKMCYAGLIVVGMGLGMGAMYALECKNKKCIDEMIDDAKDMMDDMMN